MVRQREGASRWSGDPMTRALPMIAAALLQMAVAFAQAPDDGQWTMPAKDYQGTRFSSLTEIKSGESMTMAPLVVKGKVLVGNSGGEFGVRGWLTALDAASGKIAWRAYSTGPDNEVLIGKNFKPYYASDQGKDLGTKTWPSE